MLVLLALYPVVFLFGAWVQTPLLMERAKIPFWLALFIGNVVSVVLLNWLVPWGSRPPWLVAHPAGAVANRDQSGRRRVIVLSTACGC